MTHIRKAIFPVAGLGTRFLPATKAMPKEMLPVVDRPLIQHVVDEAREAGIEHCIFVTGRHKSVIEDHFDRQFELEVTLIERGKQAELNLLSEDLPEAGTASFTRQQSPLGLGHAVWCARELVGREPFALLLARRAGAEQARLPEADDRRGKWPRRQGQHRCGRAGAARTRAHVRHRRRRRTQGQGVRYHEMVEKPEADAAPSNLSITGRYILQPEIFEVLEKQAPGAGGEIQLTDAMLTLAKAQPFYGYEFDGRSFDCGSKIGFLAANVAYALERDDIAPAFRAEIEGLLKT